MTLSKVKIKQCMEQKNIHSFSELADNIGITKQQMSVMLSSNYSPFKSRVDELCNFLDVDQLDILDEDNTEQKSIDFSGVTAIELFAGAGGCALGMEEAGINTVELVEFNKTASATLKKNRPDWNVICDDVHKVDFTPFKGRVDIVSGGFPCQAFSYAGKKLGFDDTRGTLFHELARCIEEVQPKMFFAENVKGLLSHDKGRTFKTIYDVLTSLNYTVQYKVLNAAYYGVGQKRERTIIIGIQNDLIDKIHFEFPEPDEKMTTLREALKDCPVSEGQSYSEKKKKVFELVPPGGCWVDLPEDVAKDYMGKSYYSGGGRRGMARRISWDEPCLTLTCSPSQKQTDRCHPDETRPFTVREYARIQSFPDDWEFCGGIGDKYKQIGNALPVELARRISVQIKKAIEEMTD
jgi:DNA (cytosine-5)-methyltransferase 1